MNIEECREIYKELKEDGSDLSLRAADAIAWAMLQSKPKPKNAASETLHPLHEEIILFFQKKILVQRRDKAELLAWSKIKDVVTADQIQTLKRFYRLPKSKNHDATWSRKKCPATLMNNYTTQYELAQEYISLIDKRDSVKIHYQLPEPADWRSRVVGQLPKYTWDYICKNWQTEAKLLQDPSWSMTDAFAGEEISNLIGALNFTD